MIDKDTREALQAINQSFSKPIVSMDTWESLPGVIETTRKWNEDFEKRQQEKQKIPSKDAQIELIKSKPNIFLAPQNEKQQEKEQIPGKHDHIKVDESALKELLAPLRENMQEAIDAARITCEKLDRREVLNKHQASMKQMLESEREMLEFNLFMVRRAIEANDEGRIAGAKAELEKTKQNIAYYEKQIAEGEV